MRELPPGKFAVTYAWFQKLLNLWVADIYEGHGLDFLRAMRDELPWKHSGATGGPRAFHRISSRSFSQPCTRPLYIPSSTMYKAAM